MYIGLPIKKKKLMYVGHPLLVLPDRYSFVYQEKKKIEALSNYLFFYEFQLSINFN